MSKFNKYEYFLELLQNSLHNQNAKSIYQNKNSIDRKI